MNKLDHQDQPTEAQKEELTNYLVTLDISRCGNEGGMGLPRIVMTTMRTLTRAESKMTAQWKAHAIPENYERSWKLSDTSLNIATTNNSKSLRSGSI